MPSPVRPASPGAVRRPWPCAGSATRGPPAPPGMATLALQRRRARRQGIRHGQVGAVSFIQFFGSALQVTPHFHSLVPDGVFVPREGGVCFEALPPPTQAEVERLLRVVRHRVLRLLEVTTCGVPGASASGKPHQVPRRLRSGRQAPAISAPSSGDGGEATEAEPLLGRDGGGAEEAEDGAGGLGRAYRRDGGRVEGEGRSRGAEEGH
jgi:hypothetical protein